MLFLIPSFTMDVTFHLNQIILKPKQELRLKSGHPWVFSNEIHEARGSPAIGEYVEVVSMSGRSYGFGFYNPHSLIACRILGKTRETIDAAFFQKRISQALELRKTIYPGENSFRVVHGEADFLPGLVIDKYNDFFSVQTLSHGMDSRIDLICDALVSLFMPAAIIERNESPLRTLEGLPLQKRVLRGSPDQTTISENGIQYSIDPLNGQKTGFYLDQRENRFSVRRFACGARVLDCFCNSGGFSLNAAFANARNVTGIDSSPEAVAQATSNAQTNGLRQAQFLKGDVFEVLKGYATAEERFDVIILDPPSFTRNRKTVQTAKKGYRDLNALAMRCLRTGGVLLTASCSHHIRSDVFRELIREAGVKAGRDLQEIDWRGAAPDHPTLPSVPETGYLKFGTYLVH
jgi:23S rRNA (cytosine1962-C5)-methyltransferase